jgi:hypothetical protein
MLTREFFEETLDEICAWCLSDDPLTKASHREGSDGR